MLPQLFNHISITLIIIGAILGGSFLLLNEVFRSQTERKNKNNVLVPVATAVLRGGPGVGRGDSVQKTGPEFG